MRKKIWLIAVLCLACILSLLALASCKDDAKTYTITFDPNGGYTPVLSVITNGKEEITMPVPSMEGYGFVGWYTDNGKWENLFTGKSMLEKPINGDITLYARWQQRIIKYYVTFNTMGGYNKPGSFETAIINKPQATREGYVLKDWSLDEAGTQIVSYPYALTDNITLYAIWEPATFKVNYNANGGKVRDNNSEITFEEVLFKSEFAPKFPTRKGYEFFGWYHNNTLYQGGEYNFTSDITLNAGWRKKIYTVTLKFENGEPDENKAIEYEEEYILPLPAKDGYIFDGWYNGDTLYTSGIWTTDANTTLTARWVPSGESDGFIYSQSSDKSYYIVRQYTGSETEIEIPAEYMGHPVKHIGAYAFKNSLVTNVTLPANLTNIGEGAFQNSELTTINLANVENISARAFENCENLTSITLGSKLKYIPDFAFKGCIALTGIIMPSVETIGIESFSGCASLNALELPSTIKEIKEAAFKDCSSIMSLHLPGTLEKMGQAFMGANKLTIYTRNTESEITAKKASSNWSENWLISGVDKTRPVYYGIENIAWTENFQYIVVNNKALITRYIGSDTEVDIPDDLGGYEVVRIGARAFSYSGVTAISIPETLQVAYIDNTAFEGTSLTSEDITIRIEG